MDDFQTPPPKKSKVPSVNPLLNSVKAKSGVAGSARSSTRLHGKLRLPTRVVVYVAYIPSKTIDNFAQAHAKAPDIDPIAIVGSSSPSKDHGDVRCW